MNAFTMRCCALSGAALLGPTPASAQDAAPPCPRVVLHFEDPGFEEHAAEVVAEVWALACRGMDLGAAKRGTVHVHNDAVACQEIADRHGRTRTQASPGFVLADAGTAHVLFWRSGWCRDARWRLGNLTMTLALTQASPLPREQWPAWFEAGLAGYAEGPYRSDEGWIEARRHMDREPDSLHLVRQLGGRMPAIADLLAESHAGLRGDAVRAAHRVAWIFLMEHHADATCAALRAATAAEDREASCRAMVEGLRGALGDETWERLDEGLAAFVDALPRTVDREWYPAVDVVGQPGDADFVPGSPAVTWLDRNRRSSFTVQAGLRLVQIGQGDLVFERSRGRWARVTFLFHDGRGYVFVSERVVDNGRPTGWEVRARTESDVPSIRLGVPLDLHVAVTRKKLSIRVAGAQVLDATLLGPTLAGRFGVGGPFGNQVHWQGVRVR